MKVGEGGGVVGVTGKKDSAELSLVLLLGQSPALFQRCHHCGLGMCVHCRTTWKEGRRAMSAGPKAGCPWQAGLVLLLLCRVPIHSRLLARPSLTISPCAGQRDM